MIHLTILTLGSLKESYWREAAAEYLKRLQPFAKTRVIEIKEESFDSKSNPEIIKKKEASKIENLKLKIENSYTIVLDEHGKQFSSRALAQQFNQLTNQQINNFTFIIGGPLGLDPSIIQSANLVLSLGAATLTHQMVRVTLLEQLYRAMMIQNNRPYHY